MSYTVEKGDTLWKIAKDNDISLADLKKWNGIETEKQARGLQIGHKLKLEAPEEPLSQHSKTFNIQSAAAAPLENIEADPPKQECTSSPTEITSEFNRAGHDLGTTELKLPQTGLAATSLPVPDEVNNTLAQVSRIGATTSTDIPSHLSDYLQETADVYGNDRWSLAPDYIGINAASYHIKGRSYEEVLDGGSKTIERYNEENHGMSLGWYLSDDKSSAFEVGGYKNSYEDTTLYARYSHEIAKVGDDLTVRAFAGLASGYEGRTPYTLGGLAPIGGLDAEYKISDKSSVNLIAMPTDVGGKNKVVEDQYSIRHHLSPTVGVLGLSFKHEF